MPINIRCPHCSAPATLKDKYAGKKVCCLKCSSAFRVLIGDPEPSAQAPRPQIDPAAQEGLRQRPRTPLPSSPRPNGFEQKCLVRKDSGVLRLPLRWTHWGSSHAGVVGATGFALGLLLGVGILLVAVPSRDKTDASAAPPSKPPPAPVQAELSGKVDLTADIAEIHGTKARYETDHAVDDIGYWNDPNDYVTWVFETSTAGFYRAEITYACNDADAGSAYSILVGRSQLSGTVPATGGWGKFRTDVVGKEFYLLRGKHVLTVWATAMPRTAVMNLHRVRLVPSS